VLVTVLTFSSHAVSCASGPSKFLHRCCLITRVSSADSTCWSPQDHSTVRRECRCWRQFDYDSFYADLCQSEMVRDPSTSRSVSESFDRYDTTLRSLLDVHAPVRTVCVRAARTAPWYDDDCRREKKQTRRLEKLYRRTKADVDEQLWQVQFEHQRQFLQQKLTGYWTSTIDSCKGDSKALWSKLRVQMTAPSHQNSSHFSADEFAAFFTSKINKIRASTSSAPPPVINVECSSTSDQRRVLRHQ